MFPFASGMMMGANLPPALTTLNPSDKNANVTLSNGNLTATATTNSLGVRATTSISAGKFYFEAKVDSVVSAGQRIGVATAALSLASVVSGAAATIYYASGTVFAVGAAGVAIGSYGVGDVVGMAVDATASKIWFSVNGAWNGDPVAGTGGFAIPAGTVFPVIAPGQTSFVTANFGNGFAHAAPAGFQRWG